MRIFRPCEINYQRKHPTRVSLKSPLILATENCTELLDATLPGQHRMPWLTNRFIQIFPDCCCWNTYYIYRSMSHISWSTYRPSTAEFAYHVLIDGSALYVVSHCRIIYPIVSQHWQNIPLLIAFTSSTAQGGGGSFKNMKPIREIGCCESGMAERIHWWTERCLRSPLFLSLSLTIYLPTYLSSMYLSIYRSI